jgi:acetyl-CoA carboxylase biotin carboxylase subunit
VVPGSDGELSNFNDALIAAEKVGFPLLIKASAGGGGRGIRLVKSPQEFEAEFIAAQNEAQSAFNHNGVYLERFIAHARHIEVQILGDGVNVIHLFDRECSLQRRRQKIFEEAPSPALNDQQRTSLCESAVRLAQSINYKGAGTLEYLFDAQTGEFFFIEMNTRIQVEHPISEMITGLDLIQMMLKIASGESLGIKQTEIKINGVALEMRINAEDPKRNFLPNLGTVETLFWPKGDGIRIDSHLYQGYKIPPYYDSLLAKIIIHAPTREAALNKAKKALTETQIVGMTTTIELHQWLLDYPHMRLAQFDTNSLEVWLTDYVQYALEGVQK